MAEGPPPLATSLLLFHLPNEVLLKILSKVGNSRGTLRSLLLVSKAVSAWVLTQSSAIQRVKESIRLFKLAEDFLDRSTHSTHSLPRSQQLSQTMLDQAADAFDGELPQPVGNSSLASGRGLIWFVGGNARNSYNFGFDVGGCKSSLYLVDLVKCKLFSACSPEAVEDYMIEKLSPTVVQQKWPRYPPKGPHPYRLRATDEKPMKRKRDAEEFISQFLHQGHRPITPDDMVWVKRLLLRHPRALMTWDWATANVGITDSYIHFCLRFKDVTRFDELVPISAQKCLSLNAHKAAAEWDELMEHLQGTGHTAEGNTFRGDAKYLIVDE